VVTLGGGRQLHLAGHPVACVLTVASATALSQDAALNLKAAQKAGQPAHGRSSDYLWGETELVVDCLLGTEPPASCAGGGRVGSAHQRSWGRGVPVMAVDVPSGVDATTGSLAAERWRRPDVTFHSAKSGLVCRRVGSRGEVLVWDIGIPESLEPDPDLWW